MRGMNMKSVLLGPRGREALAQFGENLRLARRRRKLTVKMVSERAGISRTTVWKIEKGDPSVAIGFYVKVLNALNLQREISNLALEDEQGRLLQDASLLGKRR